MNREQHPLSQEDLMAFIDGQLTPPLAAFAAAHVETCAACASAVADARRLSSEMAQWEVGDAPVRLTANINAELLRNTKPRGRFSLPAWMGQRRTWVFAAAGTVAVLATIVAVDLVKLTPMGSPDASYFDAHMSAESKSRSILGRLTNSAKEGAPGQGQQGQGQVQGQYRSLSSGNRAADSNSIVLEKDGSFELPGQFNLSPPMATITRTSRSAGAEGPASEAGGVIGGQVVEPGTGRVVKQGAAEIRRVETPGESAAPLIIRSVRLTLITKDFDGARARIDTIIRDTMGYVDALTDHGSKGEGRVLSATLRLPADRLDSGLKELRKIGTPQEESQKSDDVTNQFVDLSARMNNMRNTEQRLLALLRERTGVLKDVLEVEQEISRVREQIERLQAQLKNISQKVAYSTVQVDITEEYRAKIEENVLPSSVTRLRNAGVGGYELARETVLGVLIFALQFGPTLLMLAVVLTGFAFLAWRRISKLTKTAA